MGEFFQNLWLNNRQLVFLIGILIVILPFVIFYVIKAKKEHPKGLISAALSNMGERFGYYCSTIINTHSNLCLQKKRDYKRGL